MRRSRILHSVLLILALAGVCIGVWWKVGGGRGVSLPGRIDGYRQWPPSRTEEAKASFSKRMRPEESEEHKLSPEDTPVSNHTEPHFDWNSALHTPGAESELERESFLEQVDSMLSEFRLNWDGIEQVEPIVAALSQLRDRIQAQYGAIGLQKIRTLLEDEEISKEVREFLLMILAFSPERAPLMVKWYKEGSNQMRELVRGVAFSKEGLPLFGRSEAAWQELMQLLKESDAQTCAEILSGMLPSRIHSEHPDIEAEKLDQLFDLARTFLAPDTSLSTWERWPWVSMLADSPRQQDIDLVLSRIVSQNLCLEERVLTTWVALQYRILDMNLHPEIWREADAMLVQAIIAGSDERATEEQIRHAATAFEPLSIIRQGDPSFVTWMISLINTPTNLLRFQALVALRHFSHNSDALWCFRSIALNPSEKPLFRQCAIRSLGEAAVKHKNAQAKEILQGLLSVLESPELKEQISQYLQDPGAREHSKSR